MRDSNSPKSGSDVERQSDQSYAHFQALVDAYQQAPTLANYVRLRRTFGGSGTDVAQFTAFDPLLIEMELRQFGIEPWLVSDAMNGDDRMIDELALRLMEALIERGKIEKEGTAHIQSRGIAISDALVDYLIIASLETTETYDAPLPSSLIVLIRERLCGASPDRHKEQVRLQRRQDAIALAALKFPSGKVSIRSIAALMKVEPSTVSRWFPDGDFQQQVDRFRMSIDAFGLRGNY
jgi:hypothetical protein